MPGKSALKLSDWKKLLRIARTQTDTAVLGRRYVYILPTRQGVVFALVLVAMLIGSINYSLSLGFVLTFLLGGQGVIAMLHTWRNLTNLAVTSGRTVPVFAGETLQWRLLVSDDSGRERYAIGLRRGKEAAAYVDVIAGQRSELCLPIDTELRGWFTPGRLTVFTEFPLGLFHAWSYCELSSSCLVYPRPAPPGSAPPLTALEGSMGSALVVEGDDDFSGLRSYQHGDSPKRVDWKASAREQGLLIKQFQGAAQVKLWLDWDLVQGDTEQRLAQLTRWLLDARADDQPYGLRLPDRIIAPGSGAQHDGICLEALALFGLPE